MYSSEASLERSDLERSELRRRPYAKRYSCGSMHLSPDLGARGLQGASERRSLETPLYE